MMTPYPSGYIQEIDSILGGDAQKFWDEIHHHPAKAGLRGNPLKASREVISQLFPGLLTALPWDPDGFLISGEHQLGKHPLHALGLFYLQEPSAMAAVEALQPQPGERVLDLSAAPGGKATQIVSRMGNQGLLLANDPHAGRVQALARNLERWGARQTAITKERPKRLADQFGPIFDRVLVDAPCSGEGMFRSHPGERTHWSPGFVERCAAEQQEILWHAARLVSNGGILVYATCTFNRLENEQTVIKFLKARKDFHLVPIPELKGCSSGLGEFEPGRVSIPHTIRIWPHLDPGEGHFIAKFKRRNEKKDPDPDPAPTKPPAPDQADLNDYADFFNQMLKKTQRTACIQPDSSMLGQYGNRLYAVPPLIPRLQGLKVQHWGWWVGNLQKGRFSPSHALAMGIQPRDCQKMLEFSIQSPQLQRYLKGLPIQSAGEDGWVLVTTNRYPIGWGKRSKGRLKSLFPSWLQL